MLRATQVRGCRHSLGLPACGKALVVNGIGLQAMVTAFLDSLRSATFGRFLCLIGDHMSCFGDVKENSSFRQSFFPPSKNQLIYMALL